MELLGVLQILIIAIVVGGALFLFNKLPVDPMIKMVATVVSILIVAVWALRWIIHHLGG